jgi:hypothetical protein
MLSQIFWVYPSRKVFMQIYPRLSRGRVMVCLAENMGFDIEKPPV